MAKKFTCSNLRDNYNPYNVVYDSECDTEIISSKEEQIIEDAVDHMINDNVVHSLDEHPWADTQELRAAIEDSLEDV